MEKIYQTGPGPTMSNFVVTGWMAGYGPKRRSAFL